MDQSQARWASSLLGLVSQILSTSGLVGLCISGLVDHSMSLGNQKLPAPAH